MSGASPSRRDFLRVAASAGGALALGVLLPACHNYDPKTVAHFGSTRELMPNAWLKILPDDRIIFLLDRVEYGQGTATSHTTMIAEELEVRPERITIEHAPASRAYDQPLEDGGIQLTGGSSSVRTSWEPLRKAGAAAREMLKAAAAEEWDVPIGELSVDDGVVSHSATKRRATYGKLAARAARQPVPDPDLKPASEWKWIGKPIGRLDARIKVDGSAVYGIDVRVPGMVTAVVVRPPTVGGKVKGFDASAAKVEPGVLDVFEIPSGVAVVAKTYWEARSAAKKLHVKWEAGPLARMSSSSLRADYAARSKSPGEKVIDKGDVEKAWGAGKVVEAVYEVPYIAHATMEPQNATAHVSDGRCEIWAPTQGPALIVEDAVRATGLDRSKIEVHTTQIGGAFGRRSMTDFVLDAVHASMRMGRPVKVVWSREDDLQNDYYRPMTYNVLKGAIDGGGRVVGWFHRIVAQSVAAQHTEWMTRALAPASMPASMKAMLGRTATSFFKDGTLPDISVLDGARDFAYAIPNLRVEHVPVDLAMPCGFWRSVGSSENVYVVEGFLDELARAANKDPLEVRRLLLASAPQQLAVLERAAKEAGWGDAPPKGVYRGIAGCKAFGTYCAQVAEVSMEGGAARVRRVVAAIDCGTVVNPDIVRAQVEGAILFGLSAAMREQITLKDGRVEQTNYHSYEPLRMFEAPKVEVHILKSDASPQGVGEPGVPPIAPAVANAIFAATGKPVRSLPIEAALEAQR